MAANQAVAGFARHAHAENSAAYLLRLVAFVLIIIAVLRKNGEQGSRRLRPRNRLKRVVGAAHDTPGLDRTAMVALARLVAQIARYAACHTPLSARP